MRHCQVFIIFEDDDNVYEWDNNNNVDDGKITVLKICKVTKKKAIMKTITMMRLVSHHTGVRVFRNRWWAQLILASYIASIKS